MKRKIITLLVVALATLANFSNAWTCVTEQTTLGPFGASTYDLEIVGNYAYLAVGTYFKILDISDPNDPTVVSGSTISIPEYAISIHVTNNHAFIVAGNGYFYVIDVTYVQNPQLEKKLYVGSSGSDHGRGVFARWPYVYAVYYNSGLHVIDVSDPENACQVGSYSFTYGKSIALHGDYAYAGRSGTIEVFNISTPTSPGFVASVVNTGTVYRMAVGWPYLYTASNSTMKIYNISSPATPVFVTQLSVGTKSAQDIVLSENGAFAYLGNEKSSYGEIEVVNISNPAVPVSQCTFSVPYIDAIGIKGKTIIAGAGGYVKAVEFDLPPVLKINLDPNQGRVAGTLYGETNLIINCGDGQTDCLEILDPMTQVELTMYPNEGYTADCWDDGVFCDYSNPLDIWVNGDQDITAVFDPPPVLSVSVGSGGSYIKGKLVSDGSTVISCGNGSSICSGSFPSGTQIELTMYPNVGYSADHWDDGISCIDDNPNIIEITEDTAVEGVFRELEFKLPLPANYNWLLTVECGGEYLYSSVPDDYHQGDGYFALDFVDDIDDGNGNKVQYEEGESHDVPILAAESGVVWKSEWSASYGYTVVIDHDYPFDGTGLTTRYAHLKNASSFVPGQPINQGAQLGVMGDTGNTTAPGAIHLHLQFYYNNSSANGVQALEEFEVEGLLLEEYQVGCAYCAPSSYEFYPSTNE